MNKVMIIYEAFYGDIGIVADYKSAIHYLIENIWIDSDTDIGDDNDNIISLSDAFGENWQTILLNANENWFNDKFIDRFRLQYTEVYKHEQAAKPPSFVKWT